MKINVRLLLTGVLLVLILIAVVVFLKHRKIVAAKLLPVQAGVSISHTFPKVMGPETAPVKLIEYSDFECPSCRLVQETIAKIFKDYPGKIQLTYKHFPLTSHKWSIYAHQAAECMQIQGKFWQYHDKLYEKQPEWAASKTAPVEVFAKYAQEQKADMNQFAGCMADVAITREIYAEKDEGAKKQINATPTFFLGEGRFVGPREMREKGVNAIRKVLGLPEIPIPVTPEPAVAVPPVAGPEKGVVPPAKK